MEAGSTVIGLAMPVLPLHGYHNLGFGAFLMGLVAGGPFGVEDVQPT